MIGGADLSQARNLTRDQIAEACADHATRLPSGLTGKACVSRLIVVRRGP
jgi:hypothetical protein